MLKVNNNDILFMNEEFSEVTNKVDLPHTIVAENEKKKFHVNIWKRVVIFT